ncbi:MAG TPA: hypothetical protein VGX02_10925, partial [Candidatus Eremiobacteraceae bacterium]|nr:hypothetical protein [Candidatus Eremiobacteraceae bacterium]
MSALRARPRLLLVCLALLLPPALLALAAPGIDPALGMDPHATAVQPHPEGGTGSEVGVFAPPLVGTDGVVVASDATAGNGASLYVAVIDARGAASYYRLNTDAAGVIHFRAPKGTVRIEVFRHFTAASKPDVGVTSVVTDSAYHLEGAQTVSGVPARGAAILEAQPVYQRGTGASDQVSMQTRDIDPRSAQLLLNGSTANVLLRAASSRSIVAQLPKTAALGASTLQVRSGQTTTNPVACTVIEASAPTPPPLHIGQVWPVTVHIAGLAPHTQASV